MCPFAKNGQPVQPVAGEGPGDPSWILIGEGPGETERRSGRPFQGASGRLLDRALKQAGVDRSKLWVTNVLNCTPPGASDAKKILARACCFPRLRKELEDLPKMPILSLGGIASQGLLGEEFSITEMAGALHEIDDREPLYEQDGTPAEPLVGTLHGRVVFPTIHPAHILRGGVSDSGKQEGSAHAVDLLWWNLLYDIGKADRFARGDIIRFTEDIDTEWQDPTRARQLVGAMLSEVCAAKLCAIDTETDSLRPVEANLIALGIATPKRAVSVLWRLLDADARSQVRDVFADVSITKALQNKSYDRPVLARHGIPLSGHCHDTLAAHHCAFPGLPHDLQRIGTQIFVLPPWKAEYRGGDDSPENLTRYNALDTLVTARLVKPLLAYVKHTQTERAYEVDLVNSEWCEKLHVAGVPLDLAVNRRLRERFKKEIVRTRAIIEGKVESAVFRTRLIDRLAMEQAKRPRKSDPPGYLDRHAVRLAELNAQLAKGKWRFKLGSSEHVVAYLRAQGVVLSQETKKGRTATGRLVMESLRGAPDVRPILEYREAAKMLSTFVVKVHDSMRLPDHRRRGWSREGRIYPRWQPFKITARWAAEDPSFQNWSKGRKRVNRPNLRAQVVARPGRRLVGFDFDKQEAREIGLLSGDPFLINLFDRADAQRTAGLVDKFGDADMHSVFARIVWKDYDKLELKLRDAHRDFIKRTVYGALYAALPETLWRNLLKDDPNTKFADVALVVQMIQGELKGVAVWHEELMAAVARPPHELRSFLFGRRRCFPLGNAAVTDVYNWPVQTFGAELMSVGLGKLYGRLPVGADMILQIHDAAVFECDAAQVDEVVALVNECFPQRYEYRSNAVNFPIDVKVAQSWADL